MLKVIFWIIVGVLALSFFGISLQAIVTSPAGQENFGYLGTLLSAIWHWLIGVWDWLIQISTVTIVVPAQQ